MGVNKKNRIVTSACRDYIPFKREDETNDACDGIDADVTLRRDRANKGWACSDTLKCILNKQQSENKERALSSKKNKKQNKTGTG